jgi:hypothetical protein
MPTIPSTRRSEMIQNILSGVLGITVLWLYLSTAMQGIIFQGNSPGDAAELQRMANQLGVAHTTGYPLYTMLGFVAARAGEALGHSPYTAVTWMSSVFVACAVVLCFRTMLLYSPWPIALSCAAVLAVAGDVWYVGSMTETQGLQMLAISAALYCTLLHLRQPDRAGPLIGLALSLGVALSNHRTAVLILPAVGLAVLVAGTWRRWPWRRWLVLIALFALPLLSYAYLYIRATDPTVDFSNRVPWFAANLTADDITSLIRGTQGGQGLESNFRQPFDDLPRHLTTITQRLAHNLPAWLLIACVLGAGVLLWHGAERARWAAVVALCAFAWLVFLLYWSLDQRATVYYHHNILLLVLMLAGVGALPPLERLPTFLRTGATTLLACVIVVGAWQTYQQHAPTAQARAQFTFGQVFMAQMPLLTQGGTIFVGNWMPDTFAVLEYVDTSGRRDLVPITDESPTLVLQNALDLSQNVYITPAQQSILGFYDGATWFQAQGVAVSGTAHRNILQVRPADDPRLLAEADAAIVVRQAITPTISLYSYQMQIVDGRLHITLYWRATAAPNADYSVFTHLRAYTNVCVEAGGMTLLAQDDAFAPVRGTYPTRLWSAQQIIKDTYQIALPSAVTPDLALVVGMTQNGGVRIGEFCTPLLGESP